MASTQTGAPTPAPSSPSTFRRRAGSPGWPTCCRCCGTGWSRWPTSAHIMVVVDAAGCCGATAAPRCAAGPTGSASSRARPGTSTRSGRTPSGLRWSCASRSRPTRPSTSSASTMQVLPNQLRRSAGVVASTLPILGPARPGSRRSARKAPAARATRRSRPGQARSRLDLAAEPLNPARFTGPCLALSAPPGQRGGDGRPP